MPDGYRKQTSDRILTLLEGYAPFFTAMRSRAGNIADQATDGWLRTRIARSPNDFPLLAISNGRFTNTAFERPLTYNMNTGVSFPGAAATELIRRRCEFLLTITGKDLVPDNIDPVIEQAQIALLVGGNNLGLSFVLSWGPMTAPPPREVDFNSQRRLQSTITIPVEMEFLGHTAIVNA